MPLCMQSKRAASGTNKVFGVALPGLTAKTKDLPYLLLHLPDVGPNDARRRKDRLGVLTGWVYRELAGRCVRLAVLGPQPVGED